MVRGISSTSAQVMMVIDAVLELVCPREHQVVPIEKTELPLGSNTICRGEPMILRLLYSTPSLGRRSGCRLVPLHLQLKQD